MDSVKRLMDKYVERDPGYAVGGVAAERVEEVSARDRAVGVAEEVAASVPEAKASRVVRVRVGKCAVAVSPDERLRRFFDEQLSFRNPRYDMQVRYRGDAGGLAPRLDLVWYRDGDACFPRGFLSRLIDWCHERRVKFQYEDECRKWPVASPMKLKVRLSAEQERVLGTIGTRRYGILVGALNSGKRLVAMARAVGRQERTLVLVKTKSQMYAWDAFLKESVECTVGFLGDGKKDVGADVLVAIDRSFYSMSEDEGATGRGVVLVDRVDEVNPKVLTSGLGAVDCGVSLGLACGRSRKDGLTGLMLAAAGPVVGELEAGKGSEKNLSVLVIDTNVAIGDGLDWGGIRRRLIEDDSRNLKISGDLAMYARAGKRALVVSHEKKHLEVVQLFLTKLNKQYSYVDSESGQKERAAQINRFRHGNSSVLLAPFKSLSGLEGQGLQFDFVFVVYPVRVESRVGYLIAGLLRKNGRVVEYRDKNKKLSGSLAGRLKLYGEMGMPVETASVDSSPDVG
jgi:hypothetical protein